LRSAVLVIITTSAVSTPDIGSHGSLTIISVEISSIYGRPLPSIETILVEKVLRLFLKSRTNNERSREETEEVG
jgi:hypothetical protein